MAILDQLQAIGCVSEYDGRALDDATLERIVEAASWAPSAADSQPWEIIAVRQAGGKEAVVGTFLDSHLRPGTGGGERREWAAQAPLLLVVCLDHMRARARWGEIGERVFGLQDTGAALQNMLLQARELGVASCLIREFDRERLAGVLGLPRHVRPLIIAAMGYSTAQAVPKPRLLLSDYLHHETW